MPDTIPVLPTIADVRTAVRNARALGQSVGFVPTMGALHEGHASLVRAARKVCDFVVVSVFVNPMQFGPNEDFQKYPRTLESDRDLCAASGAGAVFAPTAGEMYPADATTFVEVKKLDECFEGPLRPGHFRGVCTVVLKLFNIVLPDVAVFGAKDAQQARIVKRMVRDLNVPVEIRLEPTVREADGLAMSSRNRYLNREERTNAAGIHRAMLAVRARVRAGETDCARLESDLSAELSAIPAARLDYARIVDNESLEPLSRIDRPALIVVALYLGTTRLIDNLELP